MDRPGNPAARELGYCPRCGYSTMPEGQPGSYDVCPVCHWRDDPVQFADAEYVGDANQVSLADARENFREFGAVSQELRGETRGPRRTETRDPNWPYQADDPPRRL